MVDPINQPAAICRTENRLGMRIIWDAPIEMNDGLILRADIFFPEKEGIYPVIIALGPYGKSLAFQDGYKGSWERMVVAYPESWDCRPEQSST